jgi:hypothetical protein
MRKVLQFTWGAYGPVYVRLRLTGLLALVAAQEAKKALPN